MIRLALGMVLAVAAGLSVTLAWELGAFAPERVSVALPRHASVAATQPTAAQDHTSQWVATIVARPLFSPSRRPPRVAFRGSGNAAPAGLPRLSGVLVGPFGRSAIFAADDGKPLVVGEGAHVNAWVVRTIEADAVELSGPDGIHMLHPKFQTAPTSPAPTSIGQGQRIGWSLSR